MKREKSTKKTKGKSPDPALDSLRQRIDAVDEEILALLNTRARLAMDVGKAKEKSNAEVYVPDRERRIYERLIAANKGPFPDRAVRNVFREVISASRSLEKRLKIAYLGPPATFTHQASMRHFGLSADFVPKKDISDVFSDVERGTVEFGVVPIENSTEGTVSHTLDMFMESSVKICAEALVQVSLALMNGTGETGDIKKICSHANPIAQSRKWVKEHLPGVPVYEVSSTAEAARMASEDDAVAAIASESAASLYELKVVERRIEDNINNFTRFVVIGMKDAPRTGHDKTSLMFSVKDAPGSLYAMLKPFARRKINLTKIESRPIKKKAWEYIFFLDLEGHSTDRKVEDAIEELKASCSFVKVMGSYPRCREVFC
jgi:chorismate mutase/prephenate dehydratase